MLEHAEVQKFIKTTGIRTLAELTEKFASEDPEILAMTLMYLTKKNRIKMIAYQAPSKSEKIYFIPKQ